MLLGCRPHDVLLRTGGMEGGVNCGMEEWSVGGLEGGGDGGMGGVRDGRMETLEASASFTYPDLVCFQTGSVWCSADQASGAL